MDTKLSKLFASASASDVYASAFKAAVEQIQTGLGADQTVSAELRGAAQRLNDLADLVDLVQAADKPAPAEEDDEEEEDEPEDKKEEKPAAKGATEDKPEDKKG